MHEADGPSQPGPEPAHHGTLGGDRLGLRGGQHRRPGTGQHQRSDRLASVALDDHVGHPADGGQGLVDESPGAGSIAFGVPATIVRAVLSRYVGGNALVRLTDVMLVGIGIRSLVHPGGVETPDVSALDDRRMRLAVAATAVGLASGLLADSGGFLLVPGYLAVLHLPIKSAFASSLLVSAALAVPGTIVPVALGHVDWRAVAVFGLASVPPANVGARVALATGAARLERIHGGGLAAFGAVLLLFTH